MSEKQFATAMIVLLVLLMICYGLLFWAHHKFFNTPPEENKDAEA